MNLRRDVHSAFDVITPPLGGMPERLVQTVLADKGRRRKERMAYRIRMPLALVAAILLVAVAAAAMITWRGLHNNVSPAAHPDLRSVSQLEARPLHISKPASVAECTTGPYDATGGGFGSGPVYAQGGNPISSPWGSYYHIYAYASAPLPGPVLVRAIHVFDNVPVVFIGPNASGPVVGTDVVEGRTVQQHAEAVLDTSVSGKDPGLPWNIPTGSLHVFWPMVSGEPSTSTGSTGWQIDGTDFSETFLVC